MTVFDIVRTAMFAGLGVQEKAKEFIDDLVKKGELNESQGAKLVKEWTEKADKNISDISGGISELASKAVEKISVPSREEFNELKKQVEELSERLKKLEESK
jgi:polyhydroxyalkanoate synthesis regulator phasin